MLATELSIAGHQTSGSWRQVPCGVHLVTTSQRGFSLEAAQEVAGSDGELGRELLAGVAALVESSLLRRGNGYGEPRFAMLETIREFALEQLEAGGEAEAARARHAHYFGTLAPAAAQAGRGAQGDAWSRRCQDERGNLHVALEWAIGCGDNPEAARRLAAALEGAAGRGLSPEAAVAVPITDAGTTDAAAARALRVALGVTPREGDVLALLAEGGSNREIAAALFISPRTVNFHVTNLLAKLDLDSRAAAAAFAVRHGLA